MSASSFLSAAKILAALLASECALLEARDYRLDPSATHPRILEDGRPVVPRMFYGYTWLSRPGSVRVADEWKEVGLEFTAVEDDDAVLLQLRMGEDPGIFLLDDVALVDETAKRNLLRSDFETAADVPGVWRDSKGDPNAPVSWYRGKGRGGGSALEVKLDAPGKTDGKLAGYHLMAGPFAIERNHRYRFSAWMRAPGGDRKCGVELRHQGGDWKLHASLKPPFSSQVKLAAASGVPFVSFDAPIPWPEEGGTNDYRTTFRSCQEVLDANPEARLVPRLSLNPPESWRKRHPEECVEFEKGGRSAHGSVASRIYRRDARSALASAILALESRFGRVLAGYHLTGQNTGEWFYPKAWGTELVGFEKPMRTAWERTERGSFPEAGIRRSDKASAFLDPVSDAKLLSFGSFLQDAMGDFILDMARCARESTREGRLILAFYGYSFSMPTYHNGAASTGHMALRRILSSPDVDILCGPISYADRQTGGGGLAMSPAESIAAAGKLWLQEDDTSGVLARPNAFGYPGWKSGPLDWKDTLSVVRRNVGQNLVRGFATWWMDLGATGWWNDERIWKPMADTRGLAEANLTDASTFRPDVAVTVDERSALFTANQTSSREAQRSLFSGTLTNLSRIGAPFGQWLFDEVAHGRIPARLQVHLNPVFLPAKEREALRSSLSGKHVVWGWASACFDETGLHPERSEEVTGFALKPVLEAARVLASPEGKGIGLPEEWGMTNRLSPLFSPKLLPGDEIWGRFEGGDPAVVWRALPGGGSAVYAAVPEIPWALLREMARRSGVPLVTDREAHVWASSNLLSIHAASPGLLNVRTTGEGRWRDLVTGETGIPPVFQRRLEAGETILLTRD